MKYLYHRVPDDMQGSVIYPWNMFIEKYPSKAEFVMGKYKNRANLVQSTIPNLNCLWNDVIFLSATHPEKVKGALIASWWEDKLMKFFCIDSESLQQNDTLVYLGKAGWIFPDNFGKYVTNDLEKYDYVPEETLVYYREKFKDWERPLMFYRMPHIIYKGIIETSGLEIIEV